MMFVNSGITVQFNNHQIKFNTNNTLTVDDEKTVNLPNTISGLGAENGILYCICRDGSKHILVSFKNE